VLRPGIDGEDGHEPYGAPYETESDVDDGVVKGKTNMAATTYRKHPVSFVRFWRRKKGVKSVGGGGEKKEDLTRNRSNISGSPEDEVGGRKPRRSLAVGEDKDEEVGDFELDSSRAYVEEI
jgi:hypothetical protein